MVCQNLYGKAEMKDYRVSATEELNRWSNKLAAYASQLRRDRRENLQRLTVVSCALKQCRNSLKAKYEERQRRLASVRSTLLTQLIPIAPSFNESNEPVSLADSMRESRRKRAMYRFDLEDFQLEKCFGNCSAESGCKDCSRKSALENLSVSIDPKSAKNISSLNVYIFDKVCNESSRKRHSVDDTMDELDRFLRCPESKIRKL